MTVLEMLSSLGWWIAVAAAGIYFFFSGLASFDSEEADSPEWDRCRDLYGRR